MSAPAKDKIEELMVKHGLTDIPITDINKDKAIKDLLVAEVLITKIKALDDFVKGLNALRLGDLLRKHPSLGKHVFPSKEEVNVDASILKEMLCAGKKLDLSCKEETAWEYFLQFIDEASKMKGEYFKHYSKCCYEDHPILIIYINY